MRIQQYRHILYVVFIVTVAAFAGCKKHVAAAPQAQPVQPTPPPPAPSITLRAAQNSIDRGQSTSLQWEAKNATSVRIDPEVGTVQSQGSRSISPASSVTYTAVAMGPGGSASDSARITVRVPAAAAPPRTEPRPEPRVNMADLFRQNVQTIYFDFDKSDIRPDQVARLESDASFLKQHRGLKFTVAGGCDDRGSEEYNLALGDRRANRVKEFLVEHGVDAADVKTTSYGEEKPVCKDKSEDCYQKNRRDEFTPMPVS
jgi:peptidoglycan-associated lipoprotein